MKDFPDISDELMGGNISFRFCPFQDIESIPEPVAGIIQTPITPKPGKEFFTGYSSPGNLIFEEEEKDSREGPFYLISIRAFYPGSSPEIAELLREMAWKRYILEISDAMGTNRIAGTLQSPLRFIYRFKSGSRASDRPGYELEFICKQLKPCPVYLPQGGGVL